MKNKGLANKTAPKPTIPQALLKEYRELCGLARRKDEVRRQILALLKAGARVQPGRLLAMLEVQEQYHLTWRKLAAVVGQEQAAGIRAEIEPTEVVILRVGRRPDSVVAWG
jgi:hypothetical protein